MEMTTARKIAGFGSRWTSMWTNDAATHNQSISHTVLEVRDDTAPHVLGCPGAPGGGEKQMKPNTAAKAAALLLAIVGLAALLAAGIVATRQFKIRVASKNYNCGSVIVAKDPRNLVGRRLQVPPRLRLAYSRCQKTSDDRTHTATTFLIIGMIPLLIVLCLPAISRRSRRSRRRRM
jgi:hypothetical protein